MNTKISLAPRPLYEEVAERLRNSIFSHEYAPGAWIDEQAIAAEYGISRTPMREAIKVLAAEGLITMKMRRGAYVTEVSKSDLNQIFKYAKENKVITQAMFAELAFDTRREETDSIYLKEEEISEMYQLKNLPSVKHEIVRDVFVAACFMGLRFSDYTSLNLAKIFNNRLEVIQKKTGKKVTLPIHPLVKEIFTKYNYRLPKIPNNNEFNRLIKEVGALMPSMQVEFSKQITYERERIVITKPKFQWLQGHCPRRSLVTNEFLKGTDVPTIMSISGHKSYKNFLRYIKASGEEHAEKLEKIWQERYTGIN